MVYYRRGYRKYPIRKRRIVRRRRYPAKRVPYVRRRKYPIQHKRGRRNPQRVRVSTVPTIGISDVTRQKFMYAENNFVFPLGNVDTLARVDMAMNDPFDPFIGLGGKSALYFQQMMAFYKYCRVYGATITIKLTDFPGADSTPMFFALVLNSPLYSDLPTNIDDIMALPKSRCKIMKYYPNRIGSTRFLSMFVHISDIFWYTRQQYDALLPGDYDVTNFGGIASPVNLAVCSIFYGKIDNTDTAELQCVGEVRIKYYCKLWIRQNFQEPGSDHVNPEPTPDEPIIPLDMFSTDVDSIVASAPPN